MTSLGLRLRTYIALGPTNLARVGAYRVSVRAGVHPAQRLRAQSPAGPFFAPRPTPAPFGAVGRGAWRDRGLWFGAHEFDCSGPPNWHANPFTGASADSTSPWFRIADFDPALGDIKTVWEASRFEWLLAMAQRAAQGSGEDLVRLNTWLADWSAANPAYQGPNWKCGQEASIRVMHLALAALILDQVDSPLPGLVALVRTHLSRIAPTIGYAIGQQNNHGTSEAAALFIGGSWLARTGDDAGARWARIGRRWLEDRARVLIASDGSFSQYSLVYHRLMLDTYALSETWRRHLELPAFSATLRKRLAAATMWLRQLIDADTGDGFNFGANDGARLMALADTDYRDFRPTLQWASVLFLDACALRNQGPWDQPLHWLDIPRPPRSLPEPESATFDEGGLHVLRQRHAVAYLRYPRFRFRPSQADALHLDLWIRGENWLRDAGTFSYNSSPADIAYFNGTAAHNTVQFDGRDQMPRLGRFLFGDWLKASDVRAIKACSAGVEAAAAYQDSSGARHERTVRLEPGKLSCTDRLSGTAARATLRWRLRPGDWRLSGRELTSGDVRLSIDSDDPGVQVALTTGWESRYYLQKTPLPVLEVNVRVPAQITTQITF